MGMKKKWCKHIVWDIPDDYNIGAWISKDFDIDGISDIPKNWKCCPICKTERPKK
jgi:hypothetical protein